MQRIDHPSNVPAKPAPPEEVNPGHFRGPVTGVGGGSATVLTPEWAEQVQEELINLLSIGVPYGVPAPTLSLADDTQIATLLDAYITARLNQFQPFPYDPGFVQGFRRSVPDQSVDGSTVIFRPGRCRAAGNLANIEPGIAMTKDISAAWSAGDGGGGWPSALAAPSTFDWVNAFVIAHDDGVQVDYGWDTDFAAVNLLADAGAGWNSFRQIGFDEPLGGDVVRSFFQHPGRLDYVEWSRPIRLIPPTLVSDYYTAQDLSTGCPPGTVARMSADHRYQQSGITALWTMTAKYASTEDPTQDVNAAEDEYTVDLTFQDSAIDNEPLGGPHVDFDVYGGSSSAFSVHYFTPGIPIPPPVAPFVTFTNLGYFWDRGREVV